MFFLFSLAVIHLFISRHLIHAFEFTGQEVLGSF